MQNSIKISQIFKMYLLLDWQLTSSPLEIKIMSVLFFKRCLMEIVSSRAISKDHLKVTIEVLKQVNLIF